MGDLESIPEFGEHMKLEQFVSMVKDGCFIDYDGTGYYATKSGMSRNAAMPSDIIKGKVSQEWSHVVWFNK